MGYPWSQGDKLTAADLDAAIVGTATNTGLVRFGTNAGAGGVIVGGGEAINQGVGTRLAVDGHANWLRAKTTINENPTEFIIYGAAAQGFATCTSGTSTLARVSGTSFTSTWVGRLVYIGGSSYTVASVESTESLTISGTFSASSTAAAFHVVDTLVAGTCNTSGTAVTRVSGQPFMTFMTAITIAGVDYTFAYVSADAGTLGSSAGTQAGAAYTSRTALGGRISTLRVQKMLGGDEENLALAAFASGYYQIASLIAGSGKFYPIRIGSGNFGGAVQTLVTVHPGSTGTAGDGFVSLGGLNGAEGLRVLYNSAAVNRVEIGGGVSGANIRSRGASSNPPLGIDMQGTGGVLVTNGSFTRSLMEIEGSGSPTGYVGVLAGVANATMRAKGSATDVDLTLTPKGAGAVSLSDGSAVRLRINSAVGVALVPLASATPVNNGDLVVQATSNTSLTFKFKGSDGTVRSASLTLA